ncbi:unnamed protein product [Caenorhabditis bovis]|uniref:Uncharacterized protein n=1 Tax=Caenorhabditis bovis TaxID=2654633 RepID=A0A8S1F6P1_9PELO|nr:unnamed protein product [Caenorhabditis bovis]
MSSSTKRRYGTYGRAITSPALLSTSVGWIRPEVKAQCDRLRMVATSATPPPPQQHEYAVPHIHTTSKPPADPKQRTRADRLRNRISERRTNTYMVPPPRSERDEQIDELMHKYLNKSRENVSTSRVSRQNSRAQELLNRKSRNTSPTIDTLMKRYGKSGSVIKDSTVAQNEAENQRSLDGKSCNEARLSGSEIRIKWQVSSSEIKTTPSVKRFSVTIDPVRCFARVTCVVRCSAAAVLTSPGRPQSDPFNKRTIRILSC